MGSNIAFASGQYSPESHEGRHLLAHELTHVVQQQGGRLQRTVVCREPQQAPVTAERLIAAHWFDIEGLGRDLAGRLPGAKLLTVQVINELSDSATDDLCEAIVDAMGSRLSDVDEWLRMIFVRELLDGVVTDDQEGAVAKVWISFEPDLPKAAERNRDRWRKSLWESDQLCAYIKPYKDAFGPDVIGVAKAYLEENRRVLGSEALRYGFDLDNGTSVEPTNPDYLNQIRELVPQLVLLQKQLDALKALNVGYSKFRHYATVMDEMGTEIETPVGFDPDRRPEYGPKGTEKPPWPTWAETNTQYQRISAVISAFASQYPSVYILMQKGRLQALEQAQDASKARDVIFGAMATTQEKIDESTQKLDAGKISYYDLKLIQAQLFTGDVQAGYILRHPWNEPFFQDIANDDIKGHEARAFWIDLGLTLVAAAALIAAPFTGGASAAFLVGFGIGIGAAQAGMSWDKYLKLSTMSDANVSEELALVAKGEVTAALVEAIVNTVAVFLDVYGARGAMKGATQAVKLAEKQLGKVAAEEASQKATRDALKEAAMVLGGSAFAIGMHELDDDEPPELTATASVWLFALGPETPDVDSADSLSPSVNRVVIFRVPGQGSGAVTAATGASTAPIVTGADFELHIEKALLQGQVGDLPRMDFVLPGQYNPQGWGIDRIAIAYDPATGKLQVFHLEMKWIKQGSSFVPKLGTPSAGTQTGGPWTRRAVNGFLNSPHKVARDARRSLKKYLQTQNLGKTVDDAFVSAFLLKELNKAPVRVVVPKWADFRKLYKQIAALSRLRKIRLVKVH
jgi:hypothetical protein